MADIAETLMPEGPTVAASANQNLESFQKCLFRAALVHPRELSRVKDQVARFSTWAMGIGVFAPARASMDHRLRYAPEVRNVVTGLLESLNYRIETCSDALDILGKSQAPGTGTVANEIIEQPLGDMAAEISRLNKISNTIRRASKETQLLQANDFQIKDDDGNDVESLLLGHFESYVGNRFPDISTSLQQRLSRAMLLRRKRILHRRHRQGNASIRPQVVVQKATLTMPSAPAPAPLSVQSKSKQNTQVATDLGASTITPSQIKSATTLSLDKYRVALSPSVVSSSRAVALGNHETLVFPPAPGFSAKRKYEQLKKRREAEWHNAVKLQEATADTLLRLDELFKLDLQVIGEITCPYYLYALPAQEVFDERKWQNHVKADLDPYVCLFEDCDEPDILYHHSDEWLKHMHQHGRQWRCSSHRKLSPFPTCEEYMEHMRKDHKNKLGDVELRALANRSARKTVKLFPSCPLCGIDAAEGDTRLEDHIIGHLRSVALKSLPSYQDEILNDAGSGTDSADGSRPHSRSTLRDLEADEDMLDIRAESFWYNWRPQLIKNDAIKFLGDAHLEADASHENALVASWKVWDY